MKFFGFGDGGSGHPREFRVEPKIILKRDRCHCPRLALNGNAFLGLNRLMQTFGIPPTMHETTREFIYDDHFAVLHDVIAVAAEQRVRAQCLFEVMHEREAALNVQIIHAKPFLDLCDSLLRERCGAELFVYGVIRCSIEPRDKIRKAIIEIRGFFRRRADDERRARFVDENRVHFVNDGVIQFALNHFLLARHHVIAKIIEPEFVIRAIGNIREIRVAPAARTKIVHVHLERPCVVAFRIMARLVFELRIVSKSSIVLDTTDGESEGMKNLPHPHGIAPREIVIYRHEMGALFRERVEIQRRNGRERFPLPRSHFRDHPAMQRHAADELHVIVPLLQHAPRRFACHCERLWQNLFKSFSMCKTFFQFFGCRFQTVVGQGLDARLECVYAYKKWT